MKFLVLLAALAVLPLHAEDWTTSDGKTYKDVKVIKVEADCVTVLDSDGGARIDLAKLPVAIQKKLNYDPDKAKIASNQRAVSDAQNAKAIEEERNLVEDRKGIELVNAHNKEESDKLRAMLVDEYVKIYGHVIQKLEGGYLVSVDSIGGGPVEALITDAPLFLLSSQNMVDGDSVEENIYPVGDYSYKNVQGARMTIRKFTDNLDLIPALINSE